MHFPKNVSILFPVCLSSFIKPCWIPQLSSFAFWPTPDCCSVGGLPCFLVLMAVTTGPAQTPLKSSISNWIIIFFLVCLWNRNYMGCLNADCFVGCIDSIHCPVCPVAHPLSLLPFKLYILSCLFLSSALLWRILITLSLCALSFSLIQLDFGKKIIRY